MTALATLVVVEFVALAILVFVCLRLLRDLERHEADNGPTYRDLAEKRRLRIERLESLARAVLEQGERIAADE